MHPLRTCLPDIYNQEPDDGNNDNRAINKGQCPAKSDACYNTVFIASFFSFTLIADNLHVVVI